MVNEKTLKLMHKNSFLINTARGDLVNLDALLNALNHDMICGAAIDVYDEEPPQNKKFLAHPKLITTPHIGGNAQEAVLAMGRSAILEIEKFLSRHE